MTTDKDVYGQEPVKNHPIDIMITMLPDTMPAAVGLWVSVEMMQSLLDMRINNNPDTSPFVTMCKPFKATPGSEWTYKGVKCVCTK